MQTNIPVVFIIGPTASGKTAASYELAKRLGGQIVNVDVGQFYAPLAIGTAKPAWRDQTIKAHLFDICDEPKDFSVVQYRSMVLEKISELQTKGIIPIVVGGSLFYVQSLLFPPRTSGRDDNLGPRFRKGDDASGCDDNLGPRFRKGDDASGRDDNLGPRFRKGDDLKCTTEFNGVTPAKAGAQSSNLQDISFPSSWHHLHSIDPDRAAQLHPNDHYRIQRAIDIWQTSGILPSQLEPTFDFPYPCYILSLMPDKALLRKNIEHRTRVMLEQEGWIDEASAMLDTSWEPFIRSKGLIGYDLIFDALRAGNATASVLREAIVLQTAQYAKRQMTFLRGMTKKIFLQSRQKKTIIAQRCSDHMVIPYEQVTRLVAYLQK